ncbi:hypothetical protein V8E36_005199 [Tilletia maclaganii]
MAVAALPGPSSFPTPAAERSNSSSPRYAIHLPALPLDLSHAVVKMDSLHNGIRQLATRYLPTLAMTALSSMLSSQTTSALVGSEESQIMPKVAGTIHQGTFQASRRVNSESFSSTFQVISVRHHFLFIGRLKRLRSSLAATQACSPNVAKDPVIETTIKSRVSRPALLGLSALSHVQTGSTGEDARAPQSQVMLAAACGSFFFKPWISGCRSATVPCISEAVSLEARRMSAYSRFVNVLALTRSYEKAHFKLARSPFSSPADFAQLEREFMRKLDDLKAYFG